MASGILDEEILSEFDLPTVSEILEYDENGNNARDQGQYDLAKEHYAEALRKTEEYANSLEEIKKNKELTPEKEEKLNILENRLNQYKKMINNQLDRL
jgi:hypothetical protein